MIFRSSYVFWVLIININLRGNHLADELRHLFSYVCHQNPERSFSINNMQFFLCARCTGLYLFIVTSLFLYSIKKFNISYKILFTVLLLSLLINYNPIFQLFDTNVIRFILGSLIGIPSGLILKKSLHILFLKEEK